MWLLDENTSKAMERGYASGFVPNAEQQAEFEARFSSEGSDMSSRILAIAGNSAEITINGVLTKSPDFMAMLFGGGNTTYGEIIAALASAESDENVQDITLAIDSPGGAFNGLFDTLGAIQSAKKPIKAIIGGVGASAAFAIASQASEITASTKASMVGSIGVIASFGVDENRVTVASTNAPKKAPDVTTESGKETVRETLDAMHELFVDTIASGRGTTIEDVNTNFGQGATLLAEDAKNRGMIDAVAGVPSLTIVETPKKPTANGGDNTEASMDLKTLKAEHPDVYAAAVTEGQTQEQDRVVAHLTMGEASGDMKTACEAIKDGSAMTSTLQSKYMAAGINQAALAAREGDNADAGDGTGVKKDEVAEAKVVADSVCEQLGVKVEA
jgi:ClpP class serine protease